MPYQWTLTSGLLPPGLSLTTTNSGRNGFLVGQPTQIGTYDWQYTVSDDSSPTAQTASQNYTMTVSSTLVLSGLLVDQSGILPPMVKNVPLNNDYKNRLVATELGAQNSVYTVSVVYGFKPSWLTITASPTVNATVPGTTKVYCYAAIDFSGTPDEVFTSFFVIRITSSSGAYQDFSVTWQVNDVNTIVANTVANVAPSATWYILESDKTEISEGESVTIKLTTNGLPNNTVIPWTLVPNAGTGFTSADIVGGTTSGNFNVVTRTYRWPISFTGYTNTPEDIVVYYEAIVQEASITLTAAADLSTEGTESFKIYLSGLPIVANNNWKTYLDINIRDTSQAAANPTYFVYANPSSITEGDSFNVTLETTGVSQGTKIPYRITGVTSADLYGEPLTGNFTIGPDGTSTLVFYIQPNGIYDPKIFTLSIPTLSLATYVSITDSSPTFALNSSAATISEGGSVTFNLSALSVADGTAYSYYITGVSQSDIDKPLNGTITIYNRIGGFTVTANADLTTEGSEVMTLHIPQLGLISQVTIVDSSTALESYVLNVTNASGLPLSANAAINEGDTFNITVDASNIFDRILRYEITGLPQSMCSIPLSGAWQLHNRYYDPTLFFSTSVTTSKSGETNTQRIVTVSLPDHGSSTSFRLNSPQSVPTTPTPPPSGNTIPSTNTVPSSANPLVLFGYPTSTLPNGTVNVYYSVDGSPPYISHSGGVPPLMWSITSGSLPAGMGAVTENDNGIEGSYYFIFGAPTTAGTSSFTITATDSAGVSNTFSGSITVVGSQSNTGGVDPGSGGTVIDITDPVDIWDKWSWYG